MGFRRKRVAAAIACALAALDPCLPTAAAEPATEGGAAADFTEQISVTGTRIPAIDGQTGLPVQVITREEIQRANIQTAAQLVSTISAATGLGAFNEYQGIGTPAQAGFAGVSLRGLAFQTTLILLNGRRIANYAFINNGGDLNAIPLSAIERVEVLKDGASAIYGSDAIAGVINFILLKQFQGVEAYAQYTSPQHIGGYAQHFTVGAGYGDLATQKFNAYAMVDYQKYGGIQAVDRPFAATSYVPREGLDRTNINSLPANVDTPAGVRNPTGDPGNGYRNPSCAQPFSFPTVRSPNQCNWDVALGQTIVDPSERVNFAGAFTWQIDPEHEFFLNGVYVRNKFIFGSGLAGVSNQTTFPNSYHFFLPPTSAYYPHDLAHAFNIDGTPLNVYWRAAELGSRTVEPIAEQWNIVAGVKGRVWDWRYDSAFTYNQSTVESRYTGGYVRESALFPILNSGVVNPFGPNTQDVIDAMSSTRANGTLRTGKSSITSFDFQATNEIYPLPAGPLQLAVGADAWSNRLTQSSDPVLESGDLLNSPSVPSLSGNRTVWALYAEANIPVLQALDADLAVRYDHYSDFGGTTNPKVSLRWQAAPTVLVRASAGTGFLAPSLTALISPQVFGFTTSGLSDPARCPVTRAAQDCNRQFPAVSGGNPFLKPLTSSQWSVGGVWAPTPGLSLGADYVYILVDNRFTSPNGTDIFANCPDGVTGPTCELIVRGPVDPNYPTLPGPVTQLYQYQINLGKTKVTAIDFNLQYKAPRQDWGQVKVNFTGTYNILNLRQQLDGSYFNQVNHYITGSVGLLPYWHHYLELDWNQGPWSITLTENFVTGGYDQSPVPNTGTQSRMIGTYDVWNINGFYSGFKNWTLSAGIKNLMDRNPPFSNQAQSAQVGYDPTYTDPHGRLYWIGLQYAFK